MPNSAIQDVEVEEYPEILTKKMNPRTAKAIQSLRSGKVQPETIKKYSGKGGKVFKYIPHVDATRTMIDAFDQMWDWEVVSHEVFGDSSAVAYGRLTVYFYDSSGNLIHKRSIQEVGAREPITNKEGKVVSVQAFTVLGAASRALLRCMMRAFGYGLELYREDEPEFTSQQAIKVLEDYAKQQGLRDQRNLWVDAVKGAGISAENMVDRFEDAYRIVYEVAKSYKEDLRERNQKEALAKKEAQKAKAESKS